MTQPPFAAVDAAQVSVVICCYTEDRWDDTLAAVASVQEQTPPPGEVVLVVDHNDRLLGRMRIAVRDVLVVANAEQQGLAGARNTGVAASSGRVIAFLDDDAVAETGWLKRLTEAYDGDTLGVGGGVHPIWPTTRPGWFPAEFDWVIGCSYRGLPTVVAPVRNFIGANMSLRREAFDRAGGFSHSLGRVGKHPAGCEETELCIRAGRAFPGTSFVHDPEAAVGHRVTAERTTWSYFRRRCFAEGISKSVVARLTGADAALETERAYVSRVLPAGIVRGLLQALRGRPSGLFQALAIVAGALTTAAGYARGRLTR
jgi:glycosyltransferase involved in cell wall biosynthesis